MARHTPIHCLSMAIFAMIIKIIHIIISTVIAINIIKCLINEITYCFFGFLISATGTTLIYEEQVSLQRAQCLPSSHIIIFIISFLFFFPSNQLQQYHYLIHLFHKASSQVHEAHGNNNQVLS